MTKKCKTGNKTFEKAGNGQQKLANLENSTEVNGAQINQTHNTKKEALGPNTKR